MFNTMPDRLFCFMIEQGSVSIVNAASERDMAVFAAGMIQASQVDVW